MLLRFKAPVPVWMCGLGHSSVQGGHREMEGSQEAGCHLFAERTFLAARCSKDGLGGGNSQRKTIIPNPYDGVK